ncbi:hypothetical protein Q674_06675 [Acinetobacter sp. COS3]|jgi:hypothetical protein|nr:hypothetical protein Q674_06675 [Acinetobacter sp. COS3]|tara:strand:+ start:760 stop:873 length:114 start_codon:yes stop_codon:yes gene_type:complete
MSFNYQKTVIKISNLDDLIKNKKQLKKTMKSSLIDRQ